MAGTGKSTISRTVAKSFKKSLSLGASFFFKRGEGDRANAKKFFPTITRQLANNIPQLIPGIRNAIHDDPGITEKSLKEQFDKLFLHPLLGIKLPDSRPLNLLIVVDALDECEREDDIRVILQLLPQVQMSSFVHLRFFLTSRPELPVRLGFKKISDRDHQDLLLHEIPMPVVEHDISLFLKHRFSEIRRDHSLPPDWPGDDNIQVLVKISVPLFISAATICRFVEDRNWDPEERLAVILRYQAKYVSKMEKTYLPIITQILSSQDDDESAQLLQEFQETIGTILVLVIPPSINTLSELTNLSKSTIKNRLNLLHSVLSVPKSLDTPVRVLHLSFRDFLLDSSKRGKTSFRVDEEVMHRKIASQCFAIMCRNLKKNICDLPSYQTQRTDIDMQAINQQLPAHLQYSCRFWVHHLEQSKAPIKEVNVILSFLQEHFLHWMEVMCILDIVSEFVRIIDTLQSVIQVSTHQKLVCSLIIKWHRVITILKYQSSCLMRNFLS
jgi:hypothetical protein